MALSRTLDGHQGASGFAASCRLVPVFASETLQCGLAYEQWGTHCVHILICTTDKHFFGVEDVKLEVFQGIVTLEGLAGVRYSNASAREKLSVKITRGFRVERPLWNSSGLCGRGLSHENE